MEQLKNEITAKMVTQVNKTRSPVRMTSSMSNANLTKPREAKAAIKPFNGNMTDKTSPNRKSFINGNSNVPVAKKYPIVASSKSPVRMSVKVDKNEMLNPK